LVDPSATALYASLALASPKEIRTTDNDGTLELFEIYELELDAELAVLSACSTRGGSVVAGEGVFALSRGFLGAGARRVVASLWPVEDASTAALIATLFSSIETGQKNEPPYAPLLAAAKRSLRQRKEWAAPFFWAPFVLDGAR
jgi:CHAT domain-containing protein